MTTPTSFSFPFSSAFGSGFSFVPVLTHAQQLGQQDSPIVGKDRMIDPATRSYIRTANGEWAETADSRTIMLIAMSVRLGESPFDPTHGTTIGARVRSGVGYNPEFLLAETNRVGDELRKEGVLSDLRVTVRDQDGNAFRDDAGRLAVKTEWRDLASGSPINATITPR